MEEDDDEAFIASGTRQPAQLMADEYEKYYQEHKAKYGPHVAVLVKSGNWWNMFGFRNTEGKTSTNVDDLCAILDTTYIFEKNKRGLDIVKIGVRVDMTEEKVALLQHFGYTIVQYEQYDDKDDPKIKYRKLLKVTPPGVPFGDVDSNQSQEYNRVCLYISNPFPRKAAPYAISRIDLIIGMCNIDVSTGAIGLHEAQSVQGYEAQALDETYRFLQTTRPVKITLVYRGFTSWSSDQITKLHGVVCSKLDIDAEADLSSSVKLTVHVNNSSIEQAGRQNYQEQALAKVYPKVNSNVLVSLMEDRPFAISALIVEFDELYATNPGILNRLRVPEVWQNSNTLVLAHNAIRQLDIVRGFNTDSVDCQCSASRRIAHIKHQHRRAEYLSDIIDNTCTSIGRRKLLRWIKCPSSNVKEIESRLQVVDKFTAMSSEDRTNLRKLFNSIKVDMVRIARNSVIGPKNVSDLYSAFKQILHIFSVVSNLAIETPANSDLALIKTFIETVEHYFDLEKLSGAKVLSPTDPEKLRIFQSNRNEEVDRVFAEINNANKSVLKYGKLFADLMYPSLKGDKFEEKIQITQKPGIVSYRITETYKPLFLYYQKAFAQSVSDIRWFDTPKEYAESPEYLAATATTDGVGEAVTKKKTTRKKKVVAKPIETNSDEEDGSTNEKFKSQLKPFSRAASKTTAARGKTVPAKFALLMKDALITRGTGGGYAIQFKCASDAQQMIDNSSEIAYEVVSKAFETFVTHQVLPLITTIDTISESVAKLDVLLSNAVTSIKCHYNRPKIITGAKEPFIRAKAMRHPIIEQQLKNVKFVANDLSIGQCDLVDSDNTSGVLLYGINNIGKTSYEKATVLNVILAQIGCYVAADSFTFYPFESVITRLSGQDNMKGGQGTFVVEMSELRTMTTQATKRTLAIGDEICHGTEAPSAIGIVAATIKDLSRRGIKFLFATHLHNLANMPDILALENVKFKHFHVEERMSSTGQLDLVYDRSLRDGAGLDTYGIEVAKAQGIPENIITEAFAIRRKLLGQDETIVSGRTSKYNRSVVMDRCWIEGCVAQKNTGNQINLDCHHIRFQCEADENGVIDGRFDKDSEFNLVTLCKDHHNEVHRGGIVIEGWMSTVNSGRKLIYHKNSSAAVALPDSPNLTPLKSEVPVVAKSTVSRVTQSKLSFSKKK